MVGNVRWKNCVEMEKYICCMEGEVLPEKETLSEKRVTMVKEEVCELSIQEQMEEFMFLGLRLTEGVGKKEFYEAFGEEMEAVYGKAIEKLQSQGLVTDGERIRLTPYGRDVSNYVMAEFLFP